MLSSRQAENSLISLSSFPLHQTSSSFAVSPLYLCHLVTFVNLLNADVGTICGADYAGEVVKIGPSQDPNFTLRVGDRVAGIVHGGELNTTPQV